MLRVFCAALMLIASAPAQAGREFDAEAKEIAKLSSQARYPEALARAEALAAKFAKTNKQSADYARSLGWQAYLLQVQGRFADAEPLFRESLAVLERVLPPGHPDVATALNNLGFQHQITDRLDEAEDAYKRALVLRERGLPKLTLQVADSLNNLAQVYKAQGRVDDAEPLLRRALELRSKELPGTSPLLAQSLANLAGTLELQGRPEMAEPLLRRALDIRRASQQADHPEIAGITSRLGQNLSRQGKHGEAASLFETALAIRGRSQPADHVDVASSLHDFGLNLLALGRAGEARTALTRALDIRQAALPETHPEIARTHADLARISMATGDREAAGDELLRAIRLVQSRDRIDEITRRQLMDFIALAWALFRGQAEAGTLPILDQTMQMGQRAVWTPTASAISRMAARFATQDPALQRLIHDRDNQDALRVSLERDLIAVLSSNMAGQMQAASQIRQRMQEATDRITAIDVQLKRDFPGYFSLVRPEPLTVASIRKLIGDDEALLSFVTGPDGVYAWTVTREAASWRRVARASDEITAQVSLLRNAMDIQEVAKAGTAAQLFDLGVAHDLYLSLLEPVANILKGKRHLLIAASGPLTGLPFQLLVQSSPPTPRPQLTELALYRKADWLVRHHAISVLPAIESLTALRRVADKPTSAQALIGFGNPVFGANLRAAGQPQRSVLSGTDAKSAPRTRGYASYWRGAAADLDTLRRELPPLPETEAELKTVAASVGDSHSRLLLGAAATESAVKAADLDRYRIVYFATHGLVAGEVRGLGEPALALTLPAKLSETDDGLLTASEVTQLRLDADWVVLSACNTAAGEKPGADALSGLARSFFFAGARAMLVSHWRVGSEATSKLMTSTFATLGGNATLGRAEALRKAMLDMASDETDPWSGYPAFWGAFSLIGE